LISHAFTGQRTVMFRQSPMCICVAGMARCPYCQSKNPSYAVYCGRCGREIPEERRRCAGLPSAPSSFGTKEPRSREFHSDPMIGGTCAIAAGFLGIIQGIALVAGGSAAIDLSIISSGLQVLLGLVGIAFGFLSVPGGLDARLRTRYRQTLTRAILGMVAFGFAT
jgi:hypothetical protein